MGFQVDSSATSASLIVFVLFSAVILRANNAISAREKRKSYEKDLQKVKVRALIGEANSDELNLAESELALLKEQEEAARTLIRPFGFSIGLRLPTNSANPENSTEESNRDSVRSKSLTSAQYITLGVVLISQLFLFALLSGDPMQPPSDIFNFVFNQRDQNY